MGARVISTVRSSAGGAISAVEFVNALLSTWMNYNPNTRRRPNVFGLAVSGGVDSMALAALCSEIQQTPIENMVAGLHSRLDKSTAAVLRDLKFQAFVVDHGVREGSEAEAKSVSTVLEERGIQTKVLKIDWGTHEQVAEFPNFESLARRHRFQTLGKACRDSGINSLFLAHHQDDQVETVLMRMINGHRMFGLRGMKRDSDIPECHGMHGIHESGALASRADQTMAESVHVLRRGHDTRRNRPTTKIPLATEMGGVRVYRPLLDFTKDRLVDTCKAAKMEWFEDHTNKDPTITMRNAIRYMYSAHKVPAALAPPSILSISAKFEKKYVHLQKVANSLFEAANKLFMTRSGTMRIQFPDLRLLESSLSSDEINLVASLLLRQAISFVTSREHARLQSLHGSVDRVFPEIAKDIEPSQPIIFTVSGAHFKPLPPSSSEQDAKVKVEWLVSRQPYASTGSDKPDIKLTTSEGLHQDHSWTPWMLYDGRFWFRIRQLTSTPFALRPLQKEHLADFTACLGGRDQLYLKETLRKLAPADVRWTLPAIVRQELDSKDSKEVVVALPTLDLAVKGARNLVEWEVRYKKVEIEKLNYRGTEIM